MKTPRIRRQHSPRPRRTGPHRTGPRRPGGQAPEGRPPAKRYALAAVAALALVATACGSDGGTGTVQNAGGSAEQGGYGADSGDGYGSGAASGSKADPRTGPAKSLAVRDVPELGEVVTDSAGWTLYRFDEDTAKPPRSNCSGKCASAWPPVPAQDARAAAGITDGTLGKVKRADGKWQLTLGGWPVYRYAKDAAPGDTKGHGVGGTWNALAPTGAKAGQQKAAGNSGSADNADNKPAAQLKAVDNADIGRILQDAKGRTLYRFGKDTAWPMKSNCTGACLDTWKPAKPVPEEKLSGVTKKAVGTYKRADGTRQLAIDCWPVYWFTGDTRAGDINGQNVMGLWNAVTPDGKKAKGSPSPQDDSAGSGSGSDSGNSGSDSGNSGSGSGSSDSDAGSGYGY